MPRFFLPELDSTQPVTIAGEDAHHIGFSLRMAPGETITICDLSSRISYEAEIEAITSTDVRCHIVKPLAVSGEPPYQIDLYQALPKSDKMDSIVQKAVECGVTEIIPFESRRCIIKLKDIDTEKKLARWNKIAVEAAKQCGRSYLPPVSKMLRFNEVLDSFPRYDLVLFCYEGLSAESIKKVLGKYAEEPPKRIAIVIGSEGGFEAEEAESAKKSGAAITNLGPRILRTETASGVALNYISYMFEL